MAKPVRKPVSRRAPARRGRTQRKPKKIGRWIVLAGVLGWALFRFGPGLIPSGGSDEPVQAEVVLPRVAPPVETPEPRSEAARDVESNEITEAAESDTTHWWDMKPLLRKMFIVGKVDIRGQVTVPEDTIRVLLGDIEGRPMIDLPMRSLAQRLEQHPRIREAVVSFQVPRTLSVRLVERDEEALLLVNGEIMGVDEDGVILPLPPILTPLDMPLITGFRGALDPGDTLNSADLEASLRWIHEAKNCPRVADWLSEVHIHPGGIELVGGVGGCRVIPGGHGISMQLAALNEFLRARGPIVETGMEVDLTFENYLILRPAASRGNGSRSSS